MNLFKKLLIILLKAVFGFVLLLILLWGIFAIFMYVQDIRRGKEILSQKSDTFTIPSETHPAPEYLSRIVEQTLSIEDGLFRSHTGSSYDISVLVDKNASYTPVGIQLHNQDSGQIIRTKRLFLNPRKIDCIPDKDEYITGSLQLYDDESIERDRPRFFTLYIKTAEGYFSIDKSIDANNVEKCLVWAVEYVE